MLDLTKEQLNEFDSGQSDDPFEDEMKLFLSEIRDVETESDGGGDNDGVDGLQSKIDEITVS